MKKIKKADYGQEMAGLLKILSIVSIILIVVAVMMKQNIFLSEVLFVISSCFVIIILTGIWSSRIGKLILRDKVMKNLRLNGDETIADVGCGKGLLMVAAAKLLNKGKVIGMDHWKGNLEYSYTAEMALENAKIEGIDSNIELINADVQNLPQKNNTFDIVMTSLMMHHVNDTSKAISEMIRVLKPQGTFILADIGAHRFIDEIKEAGIINIKVEKSSRLFFMPVRIIIGRKSIQ